MAVASDVRKYINLFVDGRGYAGQIEDFTPPKLALKTEEFRAGGMDAAVEIPMGMEKLEASFTLISYDKDVLSLFGVAQGGNVAFVAREVLESFDGTIKTVVHTMRGKIRELDPGASKSAEKPALKASLALTYYKLTHGGTTVLEIDVENMVRSVNGNDALAPVRKALGI